MKNRISAVLLCFFIVSAVVTNAQDTPPVKQQTPDKPLLFSQFPERLHCTYEELEQLIGASKTSPVSFRITDNIILRGTLTEKIQRSASVTSVTIKLPEYSGALFSLSLINQPGQSPIFNGRIVHPQSGDVLVLTRENNQYYFQKKAQHFFMTE